ncbi:BCR, YceG family protein ['Osedax' symbiont bacterium Rs2_46_30_T18]|nr:BCR, YceG family protein ['Osedax' symbiont bacterium Rs2_46_30_T18]
MKKFFLSLLFLIGAAAAGGYYLWQDVHRVILQPVYTQGPNKTFIVKRGVGFNRLTAMLKEAQLIDNDVYFKLYAKYYKFGRKIKAGEYSIAAGTHPLGLLQKLSSGAVVQHNVVFIEGSSAKELRAALLKYKDLLQLKSTQMSEAELLKAIGASESKLEGLLLAETYRVERGSTDIALLKRAYKSMQKLLQQQWQQRDKKLPYKTPYEALIMASIVEKETGASAERPVIAGVFINRMNIGMRLQTDPTVIYGMGDRYKGNITRADLKRPSAYNTYVINGLPPSPIATVGPEAIRAALNPEKTKYLYFVAKGNGSHQFSKSLRDHNNAVRRYQLQRKKGYRSAPSN